MLNHWLEWYKCVLMNFDHYRQWFNTAAVTVDCISRLSGPVTSIIEIGGSSDTVE